MINDFIYFSLYILLNIREKCSSRLPGFIPVLWWSFPTTWVHPRFFGGASRLPGFTPGSLVESVLLILFSYAVLCFLLCLFVCLFLLCFCFVCFHPVSCMRTINNAYVSGFSIPDCPIGFLSSLYIK
jgi:hypothetical protein